MSYWSERQNLNYYQRVRSILDGLGQCDSLLDIGSRDTPIATWGAFKRRYTIDPFPRAELPLVERVVGRWPEDSTKISLPVTVVTCLQVIEHLKTTIPFTESLFAAATHKAIISVPYKWSANACIYHVHDPIDEAKLRDLTGREPSYSETVSDGGHRRLIAVYDLG